MIGDDKMQWVTGFQRRPNGDNVKACEKHEKEHECELIQVTIGKHWGECSYCRWKMQDHNTRQRDIQRRRSDRNTTNNITITTGISR